MPIEVEDLEKYFPYYLTRPQQEGLASALASFDSSYGEFYAPSSSQSLLQGDGVAGLDVIDLETGRKDNIQGVIVSNTCDVSLANPRVLPTRIIFVPIMKLSNFESLLREYGIDSAQVSNKINAIKEQKVTNLFHLPPGPSLSESYVAVLDDIRNLPRRIYEETEKRKLFSLNLVGFYLFIFKLSIHFCRLHEGVERPVP